MPGSSIFDDYLCQSGLELGNNERLANSSAFKLIVILYAICSSQYALRSYLYIIFHAIVGGPASFLFEDKVSSVPSVIVGRCLKLNVVGLLICLNLPLSGESILCREALFRAYLCGHRCISCCSSFQEVRETSWLLHPSNAMLNQWMLLC